MAKVKRHAPTSIRLSLVTTAYVEQLQKATGWSASKVFEHAALMLREVMAQNTAGTKLISHLIATAVVAKKKIDQAEAQAAAARSDVRKAAAAVKGAK